MSNCTRSNLLRANIAFRYSQKNLFLINAFLSFCFKMLDTILIFINALPVIEIKELPKPRIGAVPTKIYIMSCSSIGIITIYMHIHITYHIK